MSDRTRTTQGVPRVSAKRVVRDAYVTVRGLRLHYRECGSAEAPAVVLLHGLTGNAWEWDPVAAQLARRFRVLALDQRGHGLSDWAIDYAADSLADDAARMIFELRLGRAAVVGHSMGGVAATLLAARYRGAVRELAIVDVGPDLGSRPIVGEFAGSLQAAALATYFDPEDAVAEWQAANPRARLPDLRHFVVNNLAPGADGSWRWRFDANGLRTFFHMLPTEDTLWDTLRTVPCATLIVRGADSDVLVRGTAARMLGVVPRGRFEEIAGGAHDLTVEQPEALAAAIDGFLSR